VTPDQLRASLEKLITDCRDEAEHLAQEVCVGRLLPQLAEVPLTAYAYQEVISFVLAQHLPSAIGGQSTEAAALGAGTN
jgi:hypothetical protein